MNRLLLLIIGGVIIVGLAVAVILALVGHSAASSGQDSALQSSVQALKSKVDNPGKFKNKLPIDTPTLQSFQAWVYNSKHAFQQAQHQLSAHQFAQIVFNDPNTMPPATTALTQPSHPSAIGLPGSAIAKAQKSTGTQCGDTETVDNQKLRFCVTALTTPSILRSSDATALVTVFAPEK